MGYMTQHFRGKYRLLAPYDVNTKEYPTTLKGINEDVDVYIKCQFGVQVFYYGRGILEAYIPTLMRGRSYLRRIEELGLINKVSYIKETDSEVIFRFKANDMEQFEKILKPQIGGAGISPFSKKNLPKTKYNIPEEDYIKLKEITDTIDKKDMVIIAQASGKFLKSISTKDKKYEDMKKEMNKCGLWGKDYIHYIGRWDDYISFVKKEMKNK